MNEEIQNALLALELAVKNSATKNCVAVRIFIGQTESSIEYETRTAEQLKRQGIAMRNMNGDWIE